MAGKTLPGVGKDGDKSGGKDAKPAPPPARDSAAPRVPERNTAPYSGPTVVDDDKVAEGLKKLRSLDEPLGPPSAVGQSVADPSSADVTRVGGPGTPTAGF